MKFQKLAFLVLFISLSLSAADRPWSDSQCSRVLGVGLLAFSAIGIGATGFGLAYGCPADNGGCQGLYWKIVPGFLVVGAGGLFSVISSFYYPEPQSAGETRPIYTGRTSDGLSSESSGCL